MIPLGELLFGLILGILLGFMLGKSAGEWRVRMGYLAAIVISLVLYGAHDFYHYNLGGYDTQIISGAFLWASVGIILGREIGRRVTG